MKRAAILVLLAALATSAAIFVFNNGLLAAPPEVEELPLPDVSPAVLTEDVPTYVTIAFPKVIAEGTRDPAFDLIKQPKLQFFDSAKGKWKNLVPLKDNGNLPDLEKKDGTFTARVMFLASGPNVSAFKISRRGPKLRTQQPCPMELRLIAKRKGERALLVSPSFQLMALPATSQSFGDIQGAPPATLSIPPTMDDLSSFADPTNVWFGKTGPDGYEVTVRTFPNTSNSPLLNWLHVNVFGSGFNYAESFEPLSVAGLQGLVSEGDDLSGTSLTVWLSDPMNSRVFQISAEPRGADQQANFQDNRDEILNMIQSLQL